VVRIELHMTWSLGSLKGNSWLISDRRSGYSDSP
jgi:hypothetical protein